MEITEKNICLPAGVCHRGHPAVPVRAGGHRAAARHHHQQDGGAVQALRDACPPEIQHYCSKEKVQDFNPFKTDFSLTFKKKTEYIFLFYVSIEELFRK